MFKDPTFKLKLAKAEFDPFGELLGTILVVKQIQSKNGKKVQSNKETKLCLRPCCFFFFGKVFLLSSTAQKFENLLYIYFFSTTWS